MPPNPSVSSFPSFRELDPSSGRQCIYLTQKGLRCRNQCSLRDDTDAASLRKAIIGTPKGTECFELLCQYILLKCCKAGQHRSRIDDAERLAPLAIRWQDEIDNGALRVDAIEGSSSAATYEVDVQVPIRYNLRSRQVPTPTNPPSTNLDPITEPRSEFRPHKPRSLPADSVSSKIRAPLSSEDFKTGSLYIFGRTSSPGHVKIGWTSVSVSGRLKYWENCGYKPNLLYKADNVPHAHRVEKLVHHELIKEWRRERNCQGCSKSHQEWFEIDKERAKQVLQGWVEVMKQAQPYDSYGILQSPVREIVQRMDKLGELVTGQRVLERFRALMPAIRTLEMLLLPTDEHAPLNGRVKREQASRRKTAVSKAEPRVKIEGGGEEELPRGVVIVKREALEA